MRIKSHRFFQIFLSIAVTVAVSVQIGAEENTALPLEENWEHLLSDGGFEVYGQKIPGSDIFASKVVGNLNAPIQNILTVLRDVENSHIWIPGMIEKTTIKNISDIEAYTYSADHLPWPFTDRDMVLHNKLVLDYEKKLLCVETKSVELPNHPLKDGLIRANLRYSNLGTRPVDEHKTYVEMVLFIDPMGHIPDWLVNMLQKGWIINFLAGLEKRSSEVGKIKLKKGIENQLLVLDKLLNSDTKTTVLKRALAAPNTSN